MTQFSAGNPEKPPGTRIPGPRLDFSVAEPVPHQGPIPGHGASAESFPGTSNFTTMSTSPPWVPVALVCRVLRGGGFKPYRILKTHGFDPKRGSFSSITALERSSSGSSCSANGTAPLSRLLRRRSPRCRPTPFSALGRLISRGVARATWKILEGGDRSGGGRENVSETLESWRSLPHEFILCDLLDNPRPLLDRTATSQLRSIWWSNAFFTIYSNWFFTIAKRRRRSWNSSGASRRNAPALTLYGADHMNSSVNSIRADEYA